MYSYRLNTFLNLRKKSELLYYNDENLMDAVGLAVEDEAVGEMMIDHCVAF